MAEQLICNQQVVGSTPITSSKKVRSEQRTSYGGFPERPKGADCKSVVTDFGGPNPPSPTKQKGLAFASPFCLVRTVGQTRRTKNADKALKLRKTKSVLVAERRCAPSAVVTSKQK